MLNKYFNNLILTLIPGLYKKIELKYPMISKLPNKTNRDKQL